MAHGEVSEIIPASCEAVFDLVHDYGRRLEWDTLLQAAYLADGFTAVGLGAATVCVGRRSLGGMALKTVYVSFQRPSVAAVKMVNKPPFFQTWAASIRPLLGRGVLARAGLPDRAPTACQSPACLPAPSVCFHPA